MSSHSNKSWINRGFEDFSRGRFDDGGGNLYVNAEGVIETIHRTDLNNNGCVDIVLPNSHGYIERGPTWIYAQGDDKESEWPKRELPNDSGWCSRIADVDNDGYPDLIVVDGENGVTSELNSYVYWGGPDGLSGERAEFRTVGAYDAAAADLTGDGRLDLLFPSAWVDHHNPGRPMPIGIYRQTAPRVFEDATERFGLEGIGATSLAVDDLNGNGRPDLVVANYRSEFEYVTDSFVYWGTDDGFDSESPLRLPTRFALQTLLADLNDDGRKEIIFCGGSQVWIYWNDREGFSPRDRTIIETEGYSTMFCVGAVRAEVADVDGDGKNELILATAAGLEIRSASDLQSVQQFLPLPCCTWVCAYDLDGDGRPDLVASKYEDRINYETESAIFWNGPGGFSENRLTLIPTAGAMGCNAGDLDGDGQPEVIINNTMLGPSQFWDDFPLYVYFGSENHDYSVDRRMELPSGGGSSCYVAADLDLDGYPDLVTTKAGGLRIFHGGPEGIAPDRYSDIHFPGNGCSMRVYVADFNRDGYLDLLTAVMTDDAKPGTMTKSSIIFYGSAEGFSDDACQVIPTYNEGQMHLADLTGNGYLDIACADKRGYVTIYLGDEDEYTTDRVQRLPIEGGVVGTPNSADLTGNGHPDLVVCIPAFRARSQSGFCIFFGGPDGFDPSNVIYHHSESSSIGSSIADLTNDGRLDLIIGAYSSPTTRVLPMEIFWGNDGGLDLENPFSMLADSSCGFLPLDLTGNGYQDLIVACHRDNLGHQVDSMILWNGPEGISAERKATIPGMGPHFLTSRDPGNGLNRKPYERYISQPFDLAGRTPVRLRWEAEAPFSTRLKFQLRWAESEEKLAVSPWFGIDGESSYFENSGQAISGFQSGAYWLQYSAIFMTSNRCKSARLNEVRVEFA
jgi:hypothetical protein